VGGTAASVNGGGMALFADGRVEAAVTGAGPHIWIFHSLLADAGSCEPSARALSDRFTVTLAHLPGFGGSTATAPALPLVADRMAEAIAGAEYKVEFIPIRSLAARDPDAPGNYAMHSRFPSPDHGCPASTAESDLNDATALDTTIDVLNSKTAVMQ
jgi:prepilin-type processing-associated H-X9-DG protein